MRSLLRREKFIPRGGPDGGDGGRGGGVRAIADRNINTLVDYRFARLHRARNGESGRGAQCNGAGAEDIELRMPVGTVITDLDTGEVLVDLARHGQVATLAQGGRGGMGNINFKSSTNRAPRQFTPGEPGESRKLRLELKVLADVVLARDAKCRQIYLHSLSFKRKTEGCRLPVHNLAPPPRSRVDTDRSFVIADIPGLIEGAAEGAGLGHQFLRHLARTRLLLHIIDLAPTDPDVDPAKDARAIATELKKYDQGLYDKPRWLVLNKIDMLPEEERDKTIKRFVKALRWKGPCFAIAALTGEGCRELSFAIMKHLDSLPREQDPDVEQ